MDLQTIRAKARRKLDETTTGNSGVFWTDNELNDYINDGYFYYWQWLIDARNPAILKRTSLDITSGVDTITLPSDFLTARLVERVFDSATVPMQYAPRFDSSKSTNGTVASSLLGYLPSYDFFGSNLVLNPTPQETISGGILLTYMFAATRLSNDTDTPNAAFPDLFHDLLVGWCVIQAKDKEEMIGGGGSDMAPFLASQAKREALFKSSIESTTLQRFYSEPWGIGY